MSQKDWQQKSKTSQSMDERERQIAVEEGALCIFNVALFGSNTHPLSYHGRSLGVTRHLFSFLLFRPSMSLLELTLPAGGKEMEQRRQNKMRASRTIENRGRG
jgi:hypothetical protein